MSGPKRYEVALFVGPCSDEEVGALARAIMELPEAKTVGAGGVGIAELADPGDLPHDPPLNEMGC